MRSLAGAQRYRLGPGDVIGVAKRTGPGERWRKLLGLSPKGLQPSYITLELLQRCLRIGRHLLLQQRLEPAGAEPFAFPAEDGGRNLGPPLIHLLSHRGRDLGEEVTELVDDLRLRGGLGSLLWFRLFG